MAQQVSNGVQEYGYFVAGEFRRSGEAIEIRSPYDGAVAGVTFRPSDGEVEAAVRAAEAAFAETSHMPTYQRAEILSAMSAAIASRREELIRLIAREAGKPRKVGAVEVDRAIFNLRNAAEEAQRIESELMPLDLLPATKGKWALVRRFPIGPILAITPFNFPLNLVGHKVAPAIASGNPVVLKPAPQAPLSSLTLAEIARDAGVPAGALNVLLCTNPQAERLVRDERLKMLSFTGSTEVGWKLKSIAGKKRVTLELGGNAGVIVRADADLELAAARCAFGGFAYAGQSCIAVQRIYAERAVFERFRDMLLDRVRALKMGDPLEEATDVGPMITREHAERIETWVKEALAGGAKVLTGGRRDGSMYEPTVLTATRPEMKVNCLEAFAPVVTLEPFDDFDEAIRRVNAGTFGLQAGLFTRDLDAAFRAFNRLEVGGVTVNEVPTFRADHMPYGGVKHSGLGREGARYAIEEMTDRRVLIVNMG
jgi:glyceraldehyde-3-phosphate dehydrogenase (NADP+)